MDDKYNEITCRLFRHVVKNTNTNTINAAFLLTDPDFGPIANGALNIAGNRKDDAVNLISRASRVMAGYAGTTRFQTIDPAVCPERTGNDRLDHVKNQIVQIANADGPFDLSDQNIDFKAGEFAASAAYEYDSEFDIAHTVILIYDPVTKNRIACIILSGDPGYGSSGRLQAAKITIDMATAICDILQIKKLNIRIAPVYYPHEDIKLNADPRLTVQTLWECLAQTCDHSDPRLTIQTVNPDDSEALKEWAEAHQLATAIAGHPAE